MRSPISPSPSTWAKLPIWLWLGLALLRSAGAQESFIVTLTERSDPTNLFLTRTTTTNYIPGTPPVVLRSQTVPVSVLGYRFTHWTLNSVRAEDFTGRSLNPVDVIVTNDVDAVAHYVPENRFTADSLVPDWYKLEFYGDTNILDPSDTDDDRFDLYTEYFRGYHPRLADAIAEDGISRRRSSTLLVLTDTNYVIVTAGTEPFGLFNDRQVVRRGSNYTLRSIESLGWSGYGFTGWFLGSNRVDNAQGFSAGSLTFTITNNTDFIAHYVPSSQDSDGDGLPDWYEMRYFNSLTNTPASDSDGDGFDIATELFRGYQPNATDQIIEDGVSRRRSASLLVLVDTNNFVKVTENTEPFGLFTGLQVVHRGTNYPLRSIESIGWNGYGFIGWFRATNRIDDPQGFSTGSLSIPVTNDIDFIARYERTDVDRDEDSLPDWYELRYFNSLTNTPAADPDGDGFNIAVEIFRGYQPNAPDQILEDGISRRRSSVLFFTPAPPGFTTPPQSLTSPTGTNVTLTVVPQGIGPFSYQWRLNGVNLPGAINISLTLSNAQPTDSGTYSVVVGNSFGFNISPDAVLLVTSPDLGLADNIESRPMTNSLLGLGSGNNVSASHQFGEPNHAGKFGSNSVWLGWAAPATGIATFSTRGSSFDTLLAVYARQSSGVPIGVTNLTLIASDDDRGGYLTSLAQFNAVFGTEYFVAVDGFVRSAGNVVLSWGLQPTNTQLPVIVQQPISLTAALGGAASFFVNTASGLPVDYQWLMNGGAIPGATNATLSFSSVQVVNVGNYQVRVSNSSGEVLSDVAFLQINITAPDGHAQQVAALEKLADAPTDGGGSPFAFGRPGGSGGGLNSLASANDFGFTSPPARGLSGTQIYSTRSNSTGIAVAWFKLQADRDGPLLVTTEGSEFDTYFRVSSGPPNAISTIQLAEVPFTYNGGTDYRTRRITFNATSNRVYFIRLDGVTHYGRVWLSWVLGFESSIQVPVSPQIAHTMFSVPATNASWRSLQWFFNDKPILGQTNHILSLTSVQPSSEGSYSVEMSNIVNQVTRDKVYLHVLPIVMSSPQLSNSWVRLGFGTTFGLPVQIQVSSDLINWTSIHTNSTPGAKNEFLDPQQLGTGNRFYRFHFP